MGRLDGAGTLGTLDVIDDLDALIGVDRGIEFSVNGREGAEELTGDVGEHGSFARADAILREKEQETSEEIIDGDGGAELGEIGGKGGGDVGSLDLIFGELGVDWAELGVRFGGGDAATAAIVVAMGTTGVVVAAIGFSDRMGHFLPLEMRCGGVPPGQCG